MEGEGSVGASDSVDTSSESAETDAGETNESHEAGSESENGEGSPKPKAKPQPKPEDDTEEVSLGAVKGRIPKALAKAFRELQRGAFEKFQKASQIEKQQKAFEEAKKDPAQVRKFLKSQGVDLRKISEDELAEALEEAGLSDEQRKVRELEARLAEREESDKKRKDEEEKQRFEAEYQNSQKALDTEIGEAFKESGLPRKRYYLARVAAEMLASQKKVQAGLLEKGLSAKEACAIVKEDLVSTVQEIITDMDPQGIHKLLGEGALKKLRDHDIASVIDKDSPDAVQKINRPAKAASEKVPTLKTSHEWRDYVAKLGR